MVGFAQVCPNRVGLNQISDSAHVATSYWQLPKSVRRNTPSKPKKTLSHTMRAFSTGCSYLLNCGLSPSAGLEVVKKSLWICIACQKSALQQIDNSSDNLIVFFLSGSGNCRLDLAKRQAELQNSTSQYGVNMGLVTLVWVNYGFNTV